jgi:origin recognition complex subunit 5
MSSSLFQLPDELLLTTLTQTFPCREAQIRALATLLYVSLVVAIVIVHR